MNRNHARIAPPHSVVLIMDANGGDIPPSMNQSLVAATESCIAVGCRAEDDGDTEITLGPAGDAPENHQRVYEGTLETPSRKLSVKTVFGTVLLEFALETVEAKLNIWANDLREPSQISIFVEGG